MLIQVHATGSKLKMRWKNKSKRCSLKMTLIVETVFLLFSRDAFVKFPNSEVVLFSVCACDFFCAQLQTEQTAAMFLVFLFPDCPPALEGLWLQQSGGDLSKMTAPPPLAFSFSFLSLSFMRHVFTLQATRVACCSTLVNCYCLRAAQELWGVALMGFLSSVKARSHCLSFVRCYLIFRRHGLQ